MEVSRTMEDPFVTPISSDTPVNAVMTSIQRPVAKGTAEAPVAIPRTPVSTAKERPKTPVTAIRLGPLGPRPQPLTTSLREGKPTWSIGATASSGLSERNGFRLAKVADMSVPPESLPKLPPSPTEEATSVKQRRQRLAAAKSGHAPQRPTTRPKGPRSKTWSRVMTRCRAGPSPPLKTKRFGSEQEASSTPRSAAAMVATPQSTEMEEGEENDTEDQTTPRAS